VNAIEQLDANVASVLDAFSEGMRAGKLLLSPSLNPYVEIDSPEHASWERGRFAAVSILMAGRTVAA
jgi:hypothetical protein